MKDKFAKYTEQMRAMLPFWFDVKKQQSKGNLGLQFLNVMGLELQDMEDILSYAYEQTKINTLDDTFTDILYKATLPTYFNMESIVSVEFTEALLIKASSLYELFNMQIKDDMNNNIETPDYYFIDERRKLIYTKTSHDKDLENIFGVIRVRHEISEGEVELSNFPLRIHHVWNFFDEFGALVGCGRLYGENNHEYKTRILDVFVNPANSTKRGLANGIARELGLREQLLWQDVEQDLVLEDSMITVNSITVDGKLIGASEVHVSADGMIIIKGKTSYYKDVATVSYIRGIELTSFLEADKRNKTSNELFKANGDPTDLMLRYIDNVRSAAPVTWNDFRYNEGMWVDDTSKIGRDFFGFIPARYDTKIKGFAAYGYTHNGKVY